MSLLSERVCFTEKGIIREAAIFLGLNLEHGLPYISLSLKRYQLTDDLFDILESHGIERHYS